jgi:hypothetical protein
MVDPVACNEKFFGQTDRYLALGRVWCFPRGFPNLWLCRLGMRRVLSMDAVATVVKPTLTALYDTFVTFSRPFDKYHFFLYE